MINKTSTLLSLLFLLFSLSPQLSAQSIDVRIVGNETGCESGNYCTDLQIRGNNGADYIGNSSVLLSYDNSVIIFDGITSGGGTQTTGTYTSVGFDNNISNLAEECTVAGGGAGFPAYAEHSYDGSAVPNQILLTLVLEFPTITDNNGVTTRFACPSIADEWVSISTICFELLNAAGNPNVQIMGAENGQATGSGTNFNPDTNMPEDKYDNGSLTGWTNSYAEFCDGTLPGPQNDNCDDAILLELPDAGSISYNGVYTNVGATLEDIDPVSEIENSPTQCFFEDSFGATPFVNAPVWFTLVGDGNEYIIHTSQECGPNSISNDDYINNGDSQMAIFTGSCGNYNLIACNDDDNDDLSGMIAGDNLLSAISLPTAAGETYYVLIDGFNSVTGLSSGEFCIVITEAGENACAISSSFYDPNNPDQTGLQFVCNDDNDEISASFAYFSPQGPMTLTSNVGSLSTTELAASELASINFTQADIDATDGTFEITFTSTIDPTCSSTLSGSLPSTTVDFCSGFAGCTDMTACNFNPEAEIDDASCFYETTWYQDLDMDGLGDIDVAIINCEQPDGFVDNSDDEDDQCGGEIDACGICDGPGLITWYEDADGDGLGNTVSSIEACDQPNGYVLNDDDEDDTCAGTFDICGVCEGPGELTWYQDADGDGLGNPIAAQVACDQPEGYVDNDDDDNDECLGELDICGVCNGSGPITWYQDADNDGLGNPEVTQWLCDQPAGYVANSEDDDDTCEGTIDECGICNGDGESTWYADADGDGLGDPNISVQDCDQPEGFVDNADDQFIDCNGTPDECGVCNGAGIPEGECDCSGTQASVWFQDTDGDGFGDANNTLIACEQPDGYVSTIVGIGEITSINQLNVYPNPVREQLVLSFSAENAMTSTINVYDVTGKLMMQLQNQNSVGLNKVKIDVSTLSVGTYFLQLNMDGQQAAIPFVRK